MRSLKEGEDQKEISIEPAQALDEVEPLPEDCYSRPISLTEGVFALASQQCWSFLIRIQTSPKFSCVLPVTTLRQRLLQPDFQPAWASQLHPRHKHLLMKRSLRCRVSDLSLSQPMKSVAATSALPLRSHSLSQSSSHRNVSTTWASRSLIPLQSSLKFSWWLCEYPPFKTCFTFK